MIKKIVLFLVIIAGASFLVSPQASANFNPGLIIDDAVFVDSQSMSAQHIQTFLNSKVSSCDTYGSQPSEYGGGTRAQWGAARYGQTIFTCLKDYSENGLSAAQIIYNTSQEFQINPQVLLVLLQKEQGLVTDTWPLSIQYRSATGYGCPDTAPCDSQYYGLTNQVRWAARMFRSIMNATPTWYTPYVLGNNHIRYSPDVNCGGSIVNIQNRATQALYNYTPYQPNQATIDAPMGRTVPCGAYGNMNFFRYFTSWFKSTTTPPYQWRYVYQAAYTDQSLSTRLSSPLKLHAGQKAYFTVSALNTGTRTWKQGGLEPIKLGTSTQNDRTSQLCDKTWENCTRPSLLAQGEVKPGEIGTFGFWAVLPTNVGEYKEHFNLVAEGQTWLNDVGLYFDYSIVPTYKWQPVSADFYTNPERTLPVNNGALTAGEKSYVTLKVKNTGNQPWVKSSQNPVRLGAIKPNDRISALCSPTWVKCDRPADLLEERVEPGHIGTFSFEINNPKNPTYYGEDFSLLIEGRQWMLDANYTMWLKTNPANYAWSSTNVSAYTDSTKTSQANLSNLTPNQRIYVVHTIRNDGNITWESTGKNSVRIGTSTPRDRASVLRDSTWIDPVRPTNLSTSSASVNKNEIATFEYWLKAPLTPGNYNEGFNLLIENKSWFNEPSFTHRLVVR